MYMINLVARATEENILNNLDNVIQRLDQQQVGEIPRNFNKDLATALDAISQICDCVLFQHPPDKMQKILGVTFFVIATLLFLAVSCGERAPLEIWETPMGERYEILQSGVIYSKTQGKIFLVRFKSKNAANQQIRQEEFCSLYKYIGKEYDLHGFDYVALDAAPSGEPIFGCTKMTVYRDMKSVDEITKPIPTDSL